jgi:hypothetical protein
VTREKAGSAHGYATGDIVPAYPYLWRREKDRGEDAGRKERPVCVTIAMKDPAGLTHMALLAITGSEPTGDQTAVELPALEIRRIGLRSHKRAWVSSRTTTTISSGAPMRWSRRARRPETCRRDFAR